MRAKTALISAGLIIAFMFGFQFAMTRWIMHLAEGMREITLPERILLGVAFVWGRFRWVLALLIVAVFLYFSDISGDNHPRTPALHR